MYVIVGGAGEVGYHVARALREEGNDVAVVEIDRDRLERLQDLDVLTVQGNLASRRVLEDEARIQDADLFIACSGDDEVNMVAAVIAKTYGCRTIARINNTDYLNVPYSEEYKDMGIDVAICPEMVAAIRIKKMLNQPSLVGTEVFAQGKVLIGEGRVQEGAMVVGRRIDQVEPPEGFNLFAIYRGDDVIIPQRSTVFHAHDRLMMAVADAQVLEEVQPYIGRAARIEMGIEVRRVMIAGATRVGIHLARLLEQSKRDVVLVERDPELCAYATDRLQKTLVVHGDVTERHLLIQENVDTFDAFVGATQVEEYNVLSALMAKVEGVDLAVALINQPELKSFLERQGIDLAVAPRLSTVGAILKHVHVGTEELSLQHRGEERLLTFKVEEGDAVAGRPIRKARLPKGEALVCAMVRGDDVIIPRGDDIIEVGDTVVVFVMDHAVRQVERLFS